MTSAPEAAAAATRFARVRRASTQPGATLIIPRRLFIITPSSLQSQCLSKVLKSERPDVDEKRTNLLRMQGEYQARIRDLEERLLNELSGIEGNILDDDSIMVSLETLKKDASEVAEQVANTAQIMASVDSVTTFYQPFAVAASRMYFTLERMPDVHFLYQTSLATFLDTVDGVPATEFVVITVPVALVTVVVELVESTVKAFVATTDTAPDVELRVNVPDPAAKEAVPEEVTDTLPSEASCSTRTR